MAIINLGICGKFEAFTHFVVRNLKNPERDFPRVLSLAFDATAPFIGPYRRGAAFCVPGDKIAATACYRYYCSLFGIQSAVGAARIIGYLTCFASLNVYQSFARLIKDAMQYHRSLSTQLSRAPSLARVKRYSGLLLRESSPSSTP